MAAVPQILGILRHLWDRLLIFISESREVHPLSAPTGQNKADASKRQESPEVRQQSGAQGIGNKSYSNIVPTDGNSIAFGRTTGQVLNIVYLNPGKTTKGGFFPKGVNGAINTSA